MPSRYPKWLWLLIVVVLRPFITFTVWRKTGRGPRCETADQVTRHGGLLIIANHLSDFDPVLVQWATPRPIHFMAKEELFEMGRLGKLIRLFRAFPVRRNSADRTAIKRAVALLKMGEVVAIFPEGRLPKPGEVLPVQRGFELIAKLAGTPCIVCRIQGASAILPYGETKLASAPGARISLTFSSVMATPDILKVEQLLQGLLS